MDDFILSFWLIIAGAVAAAVAGWVARNRVDEHGFWRLAWGFWAAPWLVSLLLGGTDLISNQVLLAGSPFGIPVWLSASVAIGLVAAWWTKRPH